MGIPPGRDPHSCSFLNAWSRDASDWPRPQVIQIAGALETIAGSSRRARQLSSKSLTWFGRCGFVWFPLVSFCASRHVPRLTVSA